MSVHQVSRKGKAGAAVWAPRLILNQLDKVRALPGAERAMGYMT